ncbi:D-aminoacyl-tRNA deacylase [Candidatus Azobacteroides pseudotrichonymphae]|uniref:D-aminoacyl-tRNA deacylase n=1 Tax=Azobacteroides pseudotrichonymphae genomovar. CFP2 TaxID=511995 RepID=DTD_AZOPC|nr:D-aminoacyl-tRNA deacylase [Candidatus Azobacteroides pseudotrichonymphae]B6YS15.1 RecName: Full=D-aminoacyl-tRNA deacylase; Short=DTD; AltName: Full=Gly-tRNA(Ala) deacylase [Candidatus Azobacteroides pseudotrichonymphae genomovar. CFP2]BAG83987.1 D-tyrosyl-tRNA deacylase [Candidatus Azobacteroides pseudotrichonymphae genomovar. CFP2]
MRVVIQRVLKASVTINHQLKSSIGQGLLIFLGIEENDKQEDIDFLVKKIVNLRIFNDNKGAMNRSLLDIEGELLCVSQFTLFASTKKGNRPSYIRASKSEKAIPLYEKFCATISSAMSKIIQTGTFKTNMKIKLINDGPVTICIDSKNRE